MADSYRPVPRRRETDDYDMRRSAGSTTLAPRGNDSSDRRRSISGQGRDLFDSLLVDRERPRQRSPPPKYMSSRPPSLALPKKPPLPAAESTRPEALRPINPSMADGKSSAMPSADRPVPKALAAKLANVLKKSRELSEHEHDLSAFTQQEQRQIAEMRRTQEQHSEYPTIPEFLKSGIAAVRMQKSTAEKRVKVANKELAALCEQLLSDLAVKPDDGSSLKMGVIQAKQVAMAAELDTFRSFAKAADQDRQENAKLKDGLAALEQANKKLAAELESLRPLLKPVETDKRERAKVLDSLATLQQDNKQLVAEVEALRAVSRPVDMDRQEQIRLKDGLAVLQRDNARLKRQNEELQKEASTNTVRIESLADAVSALSRTVQGLGKTGCGMQDDASRASVQSRLQAAKAEGLLEKRHGFDKGAADIIDVEMVDMAREIRDQKRGLAELRSQVDSLEGTLTTRDAAAANAMAFPGDDFATIREEIARLNEKVGPLFNLPAETARTASETIAQVQEKLDTLCRQLAEAQEAVATRFGELLDDETNERLLVAARVHALEKRAAEPGRPSWQPTAVQQSGTADAEADSLFMEQYPTVSPKYSGSPAPPAFPSQLQAQSAAPVQPGLLTASAAQPTPGVASGAPNVATAVSTAVTAALEAVQARVQAAEDKMLQIKSELDSQCAGLRMMVSTLDTQFNNINTKELFVAIIGEMERLYPNERQLQQDVGNLVSRVRALEQLARAASTETAAALKRPMPASGGGDGGRSPGTAAATGTAGPSGMASADTNKRRRLNEQTGSETGPQPASDSRP